MAERGLGLVIPNVTRVRTALLWDYHNSPYAGHLGVNKTLHNMQRSFWWQGMFSDISGYIRTCVSCQRRKHSPVKPSGLPQPLLFTQNPWDSVSLTWSQVFLRPRQAVTLFLFC